MQNANQSKGSNAVNIIISNVAKLIVTNCIPNEVYIEIVQPCIAFMVQLTKNLAAFLHRNVIPSLKCAIRTHYTFNFILQDVNFGFVKYNNETYLHDASSMHALLLMSVPYVFVYVRVCLSSCLNVIENFAHDKMLAHSAMPLKCGQHANIRKLEFNKRTQMWVHSSEMHLFSVLSCSTAK